MRRDVPFKPVRSYDLHIFASPSTPRPTHRSWVDISSLSTRLVEKGGGWVRVYPSIHQAFYLVDFCFSLSSSKLWNRQNIQWTWTRLPVGLSVFTESIAADSTKISAQTCLKEFFFQTSLSLTWFIFCDSGRLHLRILSLCWLSTKQNCISLIKYKENPLESQLRKSPQFFRNTKVCDRFWEEREKKILWDTCREEYQLLFPSGNIIDQWNLATIPSFGGHWTVVERIWQKNVLQQRQCCCLGLKVGARKCGGRAL